MNLIGTENKDFDIFRKELQKLGLILKYGLMKMCYALIITGFDENLEQTLQLANELIAKPKPDEKTIA